MAGAGTEVQRLERHLALELGSRQMTTLCAPRPSSRRTSKRPIVRVIARPSAAGAVAIAWERPRHSAVCRGFVA